MLALKKDLTFMGILDEKGYHDVEMKYFGSLNEN